MYYIKPLWNLDVWEFVPARTQRTPSAYTAQTQSLSQEWFSTAPPRPILCVCIVSFISLLLLLSLASQEWFSTAPSHIAPFFVCCMVSFISVEGKNGGVKCGTWHRSQLRFSLERPDKWRSRMWYVACSPLKSLSPPMYSVRLSLLKLPVPGYVCMYTQIYIYVHIHTYIHTYIHIRIVVITFLL